MPTGHMISIRMTSKEKYAGILQFSTRGEWLENVVRQFTVLVILSRTVARFAHT